VSAKSRIGIPVNLPTGATYDLLVLDHPDGYPEGKIDFKLNDTPRKITGIQKVAQTFLKVLFTRRGTDVLYPNFGTLFPDYAINANRTGVDRDVFVAITGELKDAEKQCIALLNSRGADLASQVDRITVLGLDTTKESIILYVKILTLAGESAQVAVPFPELDMKLSGQ
jgi:hypothetical protein